jgi:hypothetical protein
MTITWAFGLGETGEIPATADWKLLLSLPCIFHDWAHGREVMDGILVRSSGTLKKQRRRFIIIFFLSSCLSTITTLGYVLEAKLCFSLMR